MNAPLQPMFVMTLDQAVERYGLDSGDTARLAEQLDGLERTLADGRIGYIASDIERALRWVRRAA